MPGPKLPTSRIYACLFARRNRTFHWVLAIPHNNGETMYKFHATEDHNGWHYECANHMIVSSITICAAVQISTLPPGVTAGTIDGYLKDIPMATPAEDAPQPWTCRIWLKAAVRKLHEKKIVNCPDVNKLEYELKTIAADTRIGVEMGCNYKVEISEYPF
ncbi:hypothetical protein C8T65DRAFT_737873 [Cerioporus squamosus]|nr:hypothetical protein C8T65DRAFT_737873 [Cerioporus squamosus]